LNKQELRRLGVLPYDESVESTWHSGVTRRPRGTLLADLPENITVTDVTFDIDRVQVQAQGRALHDEWTIDEAPTITHLVSHAALQEMRQGLEDEIDRSLAEDFGVTTARMVTEEIDRELIEQIHRTAQAQLTQPNPFEEEELVFPDRPVIPNFGQRLVNLFNRNRERRRDDN
jgi:hypothetical protein